MSKKVLQDFNNIHSGRRIYVLGTGPTLLDLKPEHVQKIEKESISIAVNFSHVLPIVPTYWIAGGHPTQVAFALEHLSQETTMFFHQGPGETRIFPEIEQIVHTHDQTATACENPVVRPVTENVIIGGHNILLSASHLAYLMGASELVFVGFEQVNRLHFHSLMEEERRLAFKDKLINMREKYRNMNNPQSCHIVECVSEILDINEDPKRRWCHFQPVEVAKSLSFKPEGENHHNYPIFKKYVDQFKREGIKVLTTATEGICVRAGAEVVKLDDIL